MKIIQKLSSTLVLIVTIIVFGILYEQFLTPSNISNILLQSSILGIVAGGMTFVILSGGIDLSVGSVVALASAISAGLEVNMHLPWYLAFLGAIFVGALIGAINGGLIVYGGLQPFIATLTTMAIARGVTLAYTQGYPISGMSDAFLFWGSGDIHGFPMPIIVMIVTLLLLYFILKMTRFGFHIYAVGGHEQASRVTGVDINRTKFAVYVVSGITASIGGILLAGRLWSAQPNAALGFELDAIAAVVLGGTSLFGGIGGIGGTVIGVLIMGSLDNGLRLLGVTSYVQQVIKGTVFILAVLLDLIVKGKFSKRKIDET